MDPLIKRSGGAPTTSAVKEQPPTERLTETALAAEYTTLPLTGPEKTWSTEPSWRSHVPTRSSLPPRPSPFEVRTNDPVSLQASGLPNCSVKFHTPLTSTRWTQVTWKVMSALCPAVTGTTRGLSPPMGQFAIAPLSVSE